MAYEVRSLRIIAPLLIFSLCTIFTGVESTRLYASEYEQLERKKDSEKGADKLKQGEKPPICFEGEKRVPCKAQPKRGIADSIAPAPLPSSDGIPPAHELFNCLEGEMRIPCPADSKRGLNPITPPAPPHLLDGIRPSRAPSVQSNGTPPAH